MGVSTRRFFIGLIAIFLLGGLPKGFLIAVSNPATELRFVAWKYHLPGQKEYYRDLGRAFEHAHPGQKVVVELHDWNAAHDRLLNWISNGNGPDLTIVPDVWLAEFASGLDTYVGSLPATLLEDFNPVMLQRSRFRGQVLGLVWAASTKVLFYRTDLFKRAGLQPPSNWHELQVAAQKLNQPPGVYGLALPGAPELDTADNFYLLLWSNGGHLFTAQGRPALDSPEAVESLSFLRNLVCTFRVTEPGVVQCNRTCAEDLFARGKAAMVETGPWMLQTISDQAQPVPFAVAPLPGNKEVVTQLVTDHLVLLRSSRQKSEAVEFIKFAYQASWRLRWARLGMVPELKTVENNKFFRDDRVRREFISQLSHAQWIPLIKWEPIDIAIRNSLGQVLEGCIDPREALDSLSNQIQILLTD